METPFTAGTSQPAVSFWGAARSVTGSLHRVEAAGRLILLDCGLVRGPRSGTRTPPPPLPFDPRDVTAVVVSHAHVDHCGFLPLLVRQGFKGPIYCTPSTRDLMALMLEDSARIQEEDARIHHAIRPSDSTTGQPPYTFLDVDQTLRQCVQVPYGQFESIVPDVRFRFVDAGHILGSAMVSLTIGVGRRSHSVTFTGDVGRRGLPLLRDPEPIPPADLLLCESTYGGRTHDAIGPTADALAQIVHRTAARGGKVLIPAFSLGRMQIVARSLEQLIHTGRLPKLPVFVDSPLAADIAEVYRRHPECFNADAVRELAENPDFLGGNIIRYVRSREESRQLGTLREPCVILAASGMCEAGRILQHLKHNLDDPRCSVVLVSYQAPYTLGRQLLEPRPTVRFHGRSWNLWAEVVELNGFSAHADHDELLSMLMPLAGQVRKVCLVHGEPEQAERLAGDLRSRGFQDVTLPAPGDRVLLDLLKE
jgi:metallo-beta-lactamase family protein